MYSCYLAFSPSTHIHTHTHSIRDRLFIWPTRLYGSSCSGIIVNCKEIEAMEITFYRPEKVRINGIERREEKKDANKHQTITHKNLAEKKKETTTTSRTKWLLLFLLCPWFSILSAFLIQLYNGCALFHFIVSYFGIVFSGLLLYLWLWVLSEISMGFTSIAYVFGTQQTIYKFCCDSSTYESII